MIEQYEHLRWSQSAASGVLKNGAHLLARNTWEPLDEPLDGSIVLQVLEKCGDRYTCAAEYPSSAIPLRVLFDRLAGGPVNHRRKIARLVLEADIRVGGQGPADCYGHYTRPRC